MNKFCLMVYFIGVFYSPQSAANDRNYFGVKLRAGVSYAEHRISSKGLLESDQDKFSQTKFPFMIAFPPNNKKFSFSQWFFDYELPYRSENMNPSKINRSSLYSNFLNTAERTFADANALWTMTADFESWAIVGGYQLGLFLPLNKNSRVLKTSIGLTFGWYTYDLTLSQCSSFVLNPKKLSSSSKQSGECINKTTMDELNYTGPGLGAIVSLMFYEWNSKHWLFNAGYFEAGSITGLNAAIFKNRNENLKFEISSTLISFDIFNFAYFF